MTANYPVDTGGDDPMSSWMLSPLAGGTHDELTGEEHKWGGLTVDDFIISAWEGWKANGNKNGYKLNADGSNSLGDTAFSNGVRTAGFIQVPVCTIKDLMCGAPSVEDTKGCTKSPADMSNPYCKCAMPNRLKQMLILAKILAE
jgi:hypothetical protein